MSWDPEPAVAALFELVKDVEPVRWSTRRISSMALDAIPESPACGVYIDTAYVDSDHQRPLKWTVGTRVVFAARVDTSDENPDTMMNEWLVNLQEAMEGAGDLDGTCEHCQISGELVIFQPTSETPWVEVQVPVEILGVG